MNLSSVRWLAPTRQRRNQFNLFSNASVSESCVSLQDPVVLGRTVASLDLVASGFVRAPCGTEMCPEVFCLTDDDRECDSIKSQNTRVSARSEKRGPLSANSF